jgi:tetratricopeptide (TPR) repeat protein
MGLFDFFKGKNDNIKKNILNFSNNALLVTALLLKQIAEIDGKLDNTEKKYFQDFLSSNNILEKDFHDFIEEDEKVNALLEELKNYDDLKKEKILGLIVEMLNIDNSVDDTELNYLVELIMRYNFSANKVSSFIYNVTNKRISFEEIVKKRIDFYQNQVPKADTKKLYNLNIKASEYISELKYDDAIKKYNEIIDLIPKTNFGMSGGVAYAIPEDIMNGVIMSDVYFKRGKCHYEVKNYELALKDFKNCIKESGGQNFDAFHIIGLIKFTQGKILEALENFNKAISINNESYSTYYMRAICNASSDNPNRSFEKAISDVNEFLNNDPNDNAAIQFKKALIDAGEKTINEKGITLNIGGNQQQKEKLLETIEEINNLMKVSPETGLVEGEDDDLKIAIKKIDLVVSIYNKEKPYGLGDKKLSLPHMYFMRAQCGLQLAGDINEIVQDLSKAYVTSHGKYVPDEGLGSKLFYMIKEKIQNQ